MLEIGSGDDDGVYVFLSEEVVHVLKCSRRAAIDRLRAGGGLLAIHLPEIADRGHLDVLLIFELGRDPRQLRAAVADADVAQENAIVRALDASIGKCRRAQDAGPGYGGGCLVQKRPPVDFRRLGSRITHGVLHLFFKKTV